MEKKNSLLSPGINSSNTFNLKVSNYAYKLPKNRKKPTGPIDIFFEDKAVKLNNFS